MAYAYHSLLEGPLDLEILGQCFPNCVRRHIGVLLKRLKCAKKVLCFFKVCVLQPNSECISVL